MNTTFGLIVVVGLAVTLAGESRASAAPTPVGLGTATSFAVLAYSTVTNTGPSVIRGSVGVSPGTAITGFPPGRVHGGTIYSADAIAAHAQADASTAYTDAAGQGPSNVILPDLAGQTLVAGVYQGATLLLPVDGTLTLNAENDPNAVFIFQVGSTLTTETSSVVSLINGAQACNVFWQVGSSATLGTSSTFIGTIVATASVTAATDASIEGRLLALNGAVTLDTNTVTAPTCATAPTTTTTTDTAPTTTTTTDTAPTTTTTTAAAPPTTTTDTAPTTTTTDTAPKATTPTTMAPKIRGATGVAKKSGTTATTVRKATTATTVRKDTSTVQAVGASSLSVVPTGSPGTGGTPPSSPNWLLLGGSTGLVITGGVGTALSWRRRGRRA